MLRCNAYTIIMVINCVNLLFQTSSNCPKTTLSENALPSHCRKMPRRQIQNTRVLFNCLLWAIENMYSRELWEFLFPYNKENVMLNIKHMKTCASFSALANSKSFFFLDCVNTWTLHIMIFHETDNCRLLHLVISVQSLHSSQSLLLKCSFSFATHCVLTDVMFLLWNSLSVSE